MEAPIFRGFFHMRRLRAFKNLSPSAHIEKAFICVATEGYPSVLPVGRVWRLESTWGPSGLRLLLNRLVGRGLGPAFDDSFDDAAEEIYKKCELTQE